MRRFPQGRPRKLSAYMEQRAIAEYGMHLYYRRHRIAERLGICTRTFADTIRRAKLEGKL